MTRLFPWRLELRVVSLLAALLASLSAAAGTPVRAEDPAREVLVLLRDPPPHASPAGSYGGGYGEGPTRAVHRRIAAAVARRHGLTVVDDWPMPLLGLDCFVMAVPAGHAPKVVAAELATDPGVDWAEPMNLYQGEGGARPARLFLAEPAAREWRLTALHRIATGKGVRVAVIDSRIDRDHPDLAGQTALHADFVARGIEARAGPEQHGTGVAGVIAAKGVGVEGVAPGARLLALRACWQEAGAPPPTVCDTLSLAKALHFAIVHGAKVINMSLSGPPDPLLGRLIDLAAARGATVVSAYDPKLPGGGFPASHPGVIPVAEEGDAPPAAFAAPGRDIPTTEPGDRWYLVSGASFAAAHVSGLLALILERSPRTRGAQALVTAVRSRDIDACASLLRASGPCGCSCPPRRIQTAAR